MSGNFDFPINPTLRRFQPAQPNPVQFQLNRHKQNAPLERRLTSERSLQSRIQKKLARLTIRVRFPRVQIAHDDSGHVGWVMREIVEHCLELLELLADGNSCFRVGRVNAPAMIVRSEEPTS